MNSRCPFARQGKVFRTTPIWSQLKRLITNHFELSRIRQLGEMKWRGSKLCSHFFFEVVVSFRTLSRTSITNFCPRQKHLSFFSAGSGELVAGDFGYQNCERCHLDWYIEGWKMTGLYSKSIVIQPGMQASICRWPVTIVLCSFPLSRPKKG